MFFVLSKLLNVFLAPLFWVVFLALISFFIKGRTKKYFRLAALGVLLLFSNSAFFNLVSRSWECQPISANSMEKDYRYAVVLGGMASENMYNGLPRFSQSSDRLWTGLYLLKQNYVDTLVVSGGLGRLFDKQKAEGELIEKYLTDIGLKDETIVFESTSRNTYENARNTAQLFEANGLPGQIVLITSAFHMPRAIACFKKQGFDVEPFPADPMSSVRPLQWKDYLIPSGNILAQWSVLIREWAGMMMYKINGYI